MISSIDFNHISNLVQLGIIMARGIYQLYMDAINLYRQKRFLNKFDVDLTGECWMVVVEWFLFFSRLDDDTGRVIFPVKRTVIRMKRTLAKRGGSGRVMWCL